MSFRSTRRLLPTFALTLAFASASMLSAQQMKLDMGQPTPAAASTASGYLQQPYEVTDRVHVLRQAEGIHGQVIGNVTVIEQTDGFVLVDSGGTPGAGRRIVEMVRGISPKPVKAIVITHWHGDHHFGLSEVLKAWPNASVIASVPTRKNMNIRGLPAQPDPAFDAAQIVNIENAKKILVASSTSPDVPAALQQKYAAADSEFPLYEQDFRGISIRYATVTFTDHMSLPDAVAPIEIMFLGRAHTDGDTVVWLPRQKVLATGDIVVSPIPFGNSYPVDWIATLEKVRAFGFDVLIPGHGLPQTNKIYVDKLIAALRDVNSQVSDLAKQGLDAKSVRQKVDFGAQMKAITGDDPWLSHYFVQDWEPVAICSFVQNEGKEIVQGKGCQP